MAPRPKKSFVEPQNTIFSRFFAHIPVFLFPPRLRFLKSVWTVAPSSVGQIGRFFAQKLRQSVSFPLVKLASKNIDFCGSYRPYTGKGNKKGTWSAFYNRLAHNYDCGECKTARTSKMPYFSIVWTLSPKLLGVTRSNFWEIQMRS